MKRVLILAFALLVLLTGSVLADGERITSFSVFISVQEDGSLIVTENIAVVSTGQEIRRGIYRDFPVRYRDGLFAKKVGLTVLEVLRDQRPEPWHSEIQGDNIRIYMGASDTFLVPGSYEYSIKYRTDRQLGFFENFDELYWNVTGNNWVFPIEQAEVRVQLPAGVPVTGQVGYTGLLGASGTDYEHWLDDAGRAYFRTTHPLAPSEGLTIVVQWPKGHVTDTSGGLMRFADDNRGFGFGVLGLILVLLYYMIAWNLIGRDPRKGTIIPRFSPPEGISPAAARYLMRMGSDDRTFTAAVINLAVRGYLTIEENAGNYYLHFLDKDPNDLPAEEHAIINSLRPGGSILLDQMNHLRLGGAVRSSAKALAVTYKGQYFHTNRLWMSPGILLSVLALVGAALSEGAIGAVTLFLMVWLSFWSVGVVMLVSQTVKKWRTRAPDAIFMSLFSIPFVLGWFFGATMLILESGIPFVLVLMLILALNALFWHLLKAPTYGGRKIMDEIEGFKLFLSVSERERLNFHNPPTHTPELFEQFLPYALALGVEQQWAEQFTSVLAQAAADTRGYSPSWYRGSSMVAFGAATFASGLSGGFGSALGTSSRAPGSSSGGSGGSSGGGGGGGGGGGW